MPVKNIGIAVSCDAHEGNPADHIIDEVEKTPNTLIAMATHGRSGIGRWVMGSVTDKVLHGTTNPLLIIHPRDEDAESSEVSLNNVIVPLDGSPLAEQILPHVTAVAQALGLNVILVRVTPSADEYYRFMDHSMAAAINIDKYEDSAGEADSEATRYLDRVKEKLIQDKVSSVESRLLHGNAAKAIVDMIDETPDSLVALTTHGRSGVGR